MQDKEVKEMLRELLDTVNNLKGLTDQATTRFIRQDADGVKLIRGQRGGMGWEIHCYGDNIDDAMAKAEHGNSHLKIIYGGENNGK